MRPAAVSHNSDFPKTDSVPECAKVLFLTTYILVCTLRVTFFGLLLRLCLFWACIAVSSAGSPSVSQHSRCRREDESTEFDEASLTNTFSRNNQPRYEFVLHSLLIIWDPLFSGHWIMITNFFQPWLVCLWIIFCTGNHCSYCFASEGVLFESCSSFPSSCSCQRCNRWYWLSIFM